MKKYELVLTKREWLKEVGYQHADEFMKKIAYRWEEDEWN